MRIYIPSLHRMDQRTWEALPREWRDKTTVVCHAKDVAPLHAKYPLMDVLAQPASLKGIGPVRQWIVDNAKEPKLVMIDDDLRFSVRISKKDTKLKPADKSELSLMLQAVEVNLDLYGHVAVSAREGNNRIPEHCTEIGRPLRFLAYDVNAIRETGCRFDRIELMEDFDMTLQLLRRGYENLILWHWAHDQIGGSGAKGGCSEYRDGAMQAKAAHRLAELHPGFVKVVEKQTKTAWKGMGGTRTDVVISWKKAYQASKRMIILRKKS